MNAPGVSPLSSAQPVRCVGIPLADGLGEVRVERLEDGTVRFTDRAADMLPYTLEFSAEEWRLVVETAGNPTQPLPPKPHGPLTYTVQGPRWGSE